MRQTPIKNKLVFDLLIVKHFAEYFTRKARVALKVKRGYYKTVSVDYSSRGSVYVWFFGHDGSVRSMSFWSNGEPM